MHQLINKTIQSVFISTNRRLMWVVFDDDQYVVLTPSWPDAYFAPTHGLRTLLGSKIRTISEYSNRIDADLYSVGRGDPSDASQDHDQCVFDIFTENRNYAEVAVLFRHSGGFTTEIVETKMGADVVWEQFA